MICMVDCRELFPAMRFSTSPNVGSVGFSLLSGLEISFVGGNINYEKTLG
jgi:hypothetical protein